jgi:hypothetical protein
MYFLSVLDLSCFIVLYFCAFLVIKFFAALGDRVICLVAEPAVLAITLRPSADSYETRMLSQRRSLRIFEVGLILVHTLNI